MIRRIRIACPAATESGGPEALHQLAGALRAHGLDAAIAYYPPRPRGHAAPDAYRRYAAPVAQAIEDAPDTLAILNEVVAGMAGQFRQARRAVWWLSVDNYFKWRDAGPAFDVLSRGAAPDLLHFAQSDYARRFLARHGLSAPMLTDYITPGTFARGADTTRAAAVAYNPRKGQDVTARLMALAPDIAWVPLDGMGRSDVAAVLGGVRAYVDFGHHPGRDRLPREAALCGAVVIAGRRGAAGCVADMPLPDRFRIDERDPRFAQQAIDLLRQVLGRAHAFAEASAAQDGYRAWIDDGRRIFLREVACLAAYAGGSAAETRSAA